MNPTVYCPTYAGLVECQRLDREEIADRQDGRMLVDRQTDQARIQELRWRMNRRAVKIERAQDLLLAINAGVDAEYITALTEHQKRWVLPF